MTTKERTIKHEAQKLVDFAEQQYEYETEHQDAADAYDVVFEGHGLDDFHCEFRTDSPYKGIDCEPFDDQSDVLDYIYLGQEEIEIQLPRDVENDFEDHFLNDRGFAAQNGSDLVYAMYPDNLFVVAVQD